MNIILNGNNQDINEGANLLSLLKQFKVNDDKPGVAVALNNEVISKPEWDHIKLNENDRIEIIQAVQGG